MLGVALAQVFLRAEFDPNGMGALVVSNDGDHVDCIDSERDVVRDLPLEEDRVCEIMSIDEVVKTRLVRS
jgi:hypothetical protein